LKSRSAKQKSSQAYNSDEWTRSADGIATSSQPACGSADETVGALNAFELPSSSQGPQTSAHGIDPDALQKAIDGQVPYDGTKSDISVYDAGAWDPKDPDNQSETAINRLKETTVASKFNSSVNNSVVNGMAQTGGADAYYRPVRRFMGINYGGPSGGDVFHEALHNLTGKGDSRLAEQLGIRGGQSQDINPVLAANDCIEKKE
jgi:hypothetical protein